MDNLTHTLTGIALSQAGLNRKTRFATLALILGSNAPDVDIITRLRGSAAYFEYHRGITHSLVGLTGLAFVLTALIYFPGRKLKAKPSTPALNGSWLLLLVSIALLGHLLLDFTNVYGVRPLMPFSGRWYAWDIMPILDPLALLVLGAGLGLPAVLRLVSEEVGAKKTGYRREATVGLVFLVLLWGWRDINHRRVLVLLESNNYGGEPPLRVGAFPTLSPLSWMGVIETDAAFHVLETSALANDVDADRAAIFHKSEPSPALDAALQTHLGRVFLNFARFPWAQLDENQDGYEVRIRDLRFGAGSPGIFQVRIELDRDLRIRSQSFTFMAPQK